MPKRTLKKKEQLTIGDRTISITDGYGIRGKDFKNREGQHSKGIDITTDNNRVISLTDGVVEVASLQGSPTLVGTDKEQSGGYYLIIKNDDGTRSQYMHLDAMTPDEQKNIIGKRVKRGDDIGGYGVGSGSGTGPHVKYRVFTGEVGTQSKTHIDPSDYITGNNQPPSPPKPKYVGGKDEKGSYIEILNNKGFKDEYYVKQYVNGAEQLGSRTIGNTEYIVKGYTDDNGILQTEYLSHIEKGSQKNKLVKENKLKVYNREIDKIMEGGLTEENVNKAKDVFETAQQDLTAQDEELPENEKRLSKIGNNFYKNAAGPLLREQLKAVAKQNADKLFSLQNDYSKASGDEKIKIGEEIKKKEKQHQESELQRNSITKQLDNIDKNLAPTFEKGTPAVAMFNSNPDKYIERDKFKWYTDLLNDEGQKFKNSESFKEYNDNLIATEEAKAKSINDANASNNSGATKTSAINLTKSNALTGTNETIPDPNNIKDKSEDFDESGKDYYDKDYLEKQLSEVQKQLSNSKKAEEFTPDLSALESKDKYGNLIAQAGDLGAGIIGLQGAMEEVPVYNKGDRFNQYTEEAYNQRNMGLSSEESGLRKQLAERGFGYDVKNIRRLSGGSAGVALGNLGRASSGLQNRYAQIAAEDSAVRRMNQQRFDRSALADESFNRKKFEDSFKTTMLNKEMGAQLVRDKMKNMNERAQFEKQYGEGSIYNEISKEVLTGKQYNNHALKMAQQYQKQKAEDYLTDREEQIKTKLEKANKS